MLFEGVADTRTLPATSMLLRSKLPYLLSLFLKPDLSERKVGKHKPVCDSIRSEKHLCLCCKGLVSTTCKLELGQILQTQKYPNLGFPTGDKFFEILLGLASTRLKPSCFVTESLLPYLLPLEDTLQ